MAEPNEARGEFKATILETELILVPSFKRIKQVETVLGRSLVQVAGELVAGIGLTVTELVVSLDILAKEPKPNRDEIGDLVVRAGYAKTVPAVQELINRVVFGEKGDDDDEGNVPEGSSSDD